MTGPTRQHALDLLAAVEGLYEMGGPVYEAGVAHDPNDWHGTLLAELNDPANMDPDHFAATLRGCTLDSAAGLRVLVRLSAAAAVAKAIRYLLAEPPFEGSTRPATQQDVIDEVCITQRWLRVD